MINCGHCKGTGWTLVGGSVMGYACSICKGLGTIQIRRTSDMMYPLEEPNGWFLGIAQHRHELVGVTHRTPMALSEGAWLVTFQKTVGSVATVTGTGWSLQEAWTKAAELARANG